MIKYEKEIDSLMRDLFYDHALTEDENKELIKKMYTVAKTSKDHLSKQLEIGVTNGWPINAQIKLLKATLIQHAKVK